MYCSKCKENKDIKYFWKKSSTKTGYNNWCKECCKISARVSNKTPKQLLEASLKNATVLENKILKKDGKKICSTCKEIFEFKKATETRCKKCESIKYKKYIAKNPRKVDKEYHKEYMREYRKNKKGLVK